VDFILKQIHLYPGEITLVTIGPLINVGELIERDPQGFRKLKRVVMMGGSIRHGFGDPSDPTDAPTNEYNVAADVAASKALFQSGVPIYVMPTDSTAHLKLDEVKRDMLLTKGTALTNSLAVLYLMWGGVTPTLFDPMTVAVIIDPGLCPVQPMRIVVDDKGFTREESGEPNAQVCLRSDPEIFFRFFMARF
jgi:inosine-uridine nucleoside N-ribohydrolase